MEVTMDYPQLFTLAASIISLLASLLALYISTRLAIDKERRQLLWSKELDRVLALEESSGRLVEEIGTYGPIPADRTSLADRMSALEQAAGRFGRYPNVSGAVRELHNVLGRLFAAKRDHADARPIRLELDPAYRKLLAACDSVIKRSTLKL
jgi:hypothetical protein